MRDHGENPNRPEASPPSHNREVGSSSLPPATDTYAGLGASAPPPPPRCQQKCQHDVLREALPDVLRVLANADPLQQAMLRGQLRGLRPDELRPWLHWAQEQVETQAHRRDREAVQARARQRAERVTELFQAGLSDTAIAKAVGTTPDSIRSERSRLGLRRVTAHDGTRRNMTPHAATIHRMTDKDLLTVEEAAQLLHMSRRFVYDHAEELGAMRLSDAPNGQLRFYRSRLVAWLDSRKLVAA